MNTDVSLVLAVSILSAFVIYHGEAIGQWISRQLARRRGSVSDAWVKERRQTECKVIPFEGIQWTRPFDRARDYSSEPRDAA